MLVYLLIDKGVRDDKSSQDVLEADGREQASFYKLRYWRPGLPKPVSTKDRDDSSDPR